jgi:AraC-like DNA-binding protein
MILDPESDWVEVYVCIGATICRSLIDGGMIDPRRPVLERMVDAQLALRLLANLTSLKSAPDAMLPRELGRAIDFLADLLTPPVPTSDPDQRLVAAACARMAEDLDAPFSPQALVRDLDCDYGRFRKLFQRLTGVAPYRWRMRRRMDRARELLLDGRLSVAEIARAVGFADPALFTTRFRRHTGSTPSRFRASGRMG